MNIFQMAGSNAFKSESEFREAVFEHFGVKDNPKKDRCYAIAYDMGHSCGYSDVLCHFQDLVELIK